MKTITLFGIRWTIGWHSRIEETGERISSWSFELWPSGLAMPLLISPSHFGRMDFTTAFPGEYEHTFGSLHLGAFWIAFSNNLNRKV
jgi:hypothetical protein